jgi:diguanylate cyclase (GGDEF)-like protein
MIKIDFSRILPHNYIKKEDKKFPMMVSHSGFIKKIVALLQEDEVRKDYLISQIKELTRLDNKEYIHSQMLELFVHLSFNEEEAKQHWENIFANYQYYKKKLSRNVGLRVAMFDYFINLNQMLTSPILVEMRLFKETEKLTMIDEMTGLFNRRYFNLSMKKELRRAIRYDKLLSLLLLDIDDFKLINDTKGHLFGDETLIKLGQLLCHACREEDIVCRYGGEEFIIILPETTSNGALKFGERFKDSLQENPFFRENRITLSGGIATYPYDGNEVIELIKIADKSLYAAKFAGKDRIIIGREESRRFKRNPYSWKLIYKQLNDTFIENRDNAVYSQDISLGGIRFESTQLLPLDSKLLLNISLPENDEIILLGKVVWLKKVNESLYAYGVQFLDTTNEQLNKLKKILSNFDNHVPEQ